MSEEEVKATEAAPATNGEGKANGKDRKPRDETPIEELYDLSKPIPKEERPDKAAHEKEIEELNSTMDSLKEARKKVQDKIDSAMSDPESKSKLQEARTKMNGLKTKKNALIEEKKKLRAQLDQAKNQSDKIVKDKKDARSNVKHKSVEEIDEAIKKLQRIQETTSMTLNEEKKLIKEMDALRNSKKFVADIKNKDAAMLDIKEQRKVIAAQITAKDKEIDGFSKEIDEIMKVIKGINDKESSKRDTVKELFKERDDIKKKMDETVADRNALRAANREKMNKWHNYQRAVRAQKKIQYEEEKARRDAERAEYEAQLAAEEAKKIPYEAEQNLCEYLANFLETTYLGKDSQEKTEKKEDIVAVKEDPFAGMKPVGKKFDEAEEFFGKGKGKKKRVRAAKKQDSAAGPFTLSVDMFDQFGLIQLNPPTKLEEVEKSVKELREKKAWYKEQPRGSVPTAQDIRKANEKAAAKLRQETTTTTTEVKKPKAPGKFSLQDEEFVPLGVGAAATTVNSSWGQKPATQES
uniref:Nuclear segregation protein Bfr1 n=1 Tax=Amphora coffeiformis TaxID=265554 RepID=A0A7S3L5N1_9STRA|mmetsp:Transcript_4571/g.9221  ORF Transcript_4571/g.9221 Transcript_4571/m.9221 type:complete len:522 (+) Transcript_4571:145-1710(+)